jgi:hypothetical protein
LDKQESLLNASINCSPELIKILDSRVCPVVTLQLQKGVEFLDECLVDRIEGDSVCFPEFYQSVSESNVFLTGAKLLCLIMVTDHRVEERQKVRFQSFRAS